jgi:hypothetical protein
VSTFKIKSHWANQPKHHVGDELEASLCNLSMFLDEKNVTRYETTNAKEFDSLRIPAYYIAEWIAENWWALLFEPRKGDDADDSDYLSRHSLLTAQHGFALPSVLFVPTGRALHIHVTPRRAQFADAEFRARAFGEVSRDDISTGLDKFVSDCVSSMAKNGCSGTPLNEAWNRIKQTNAEQVEFCQLVGALGLSPYNVPSEIAGAIDRQLLTTVLGNPA